MKKILILVDPDHLDNNVAESCIILGLTIPANFMLFSSYNSIPLSGFYAGTPWIDQGISLWKQETKGKLEKLAVWLDSRFKRFEAGLHKPSIQTHIAEGDLGPSVKHYMEEHEVEMVAMGAKTGKTIDHILMGSDTQSVINESERPILIIPKEIALAKITKITYASDFNIEEIPALNYLIYLRHHLKFEIEVVHICRIDDHPTSIASKKSEFMEQAQENNCLSLNYTVLRGNEITSRLLQHTKDSRSDVLAIMHHQHNFFGRLITKSMTKALVTNQHIPILVLPSKMR